MEILVFGHKNPDTDSICSALAYANFKNALGENAKACRLGNINDETQFILDYLTIDAPELIEDAAGQNVILVDHNEFGQSANNIEKATILEVIDHHRVSNFETSEPLFMNLRPYGCTATIIYNMYKSENVEITEEIATLLVSAIISDTLMFKSPTCTKADIDAANDLKEIAEISFESYGMDLLKAGTNLDKFTAAELLNIDSKPFEIEIGHAVVAQVNTVDLASFEANFETEVLAEMQKSVDGGVEMHVLLVTDILNSNSLAYVLGNTEYFENKFNLTLENNKTLMEGVVSRKKQIVPFI